MSNIHVCLVSDQTVPNILGIYHVKPERVIFCTTDRMEKEKRRDAIINTLKLYGLNYSNAHDIVQVDQDCLDDCEIKFNNEIAKKYKNKKLVINLTGGTKIMVLAAYNVFKDVAEQMIYTPIPKNEFLIVTPRTDNCKSPVSLNLRLSVEAYVTAYGVKVKNPHKIEQLKSTAKKNENICKWMIKSYKDIEELLSEFYKQLNVPRSEGKKKYLLKMDYQPKTRKEREFLELLRIPEKNIEKTILKEEIKFLTGDWLSDYCFNEISKLAVDDCVTAIELESLKGTDNEFDVMFTKDNALYIVECKSLKQKHDKDADILFKISALQHDFGLRVNGFLVSTARTIIDKNERIRDSIIRRAEQCKSQVIHPDKIVDFGMWIRKYVKGLN